MLVRASTNNVDAFQDTTALRAVHWIIDAWKDVPADKVANCWKQSQLLGVSRGSISQMESSAEEQECRDLIRGFNIPPSRSMNLATLVNPSDEVVEDISASVLEQVAQAYSQVLA